MLVAMMVEDEHGKGQRSQIPSLLRYNEQYETSSTQQTRSKGGKVTTNTVRNNVVRRVDYGVEIMCLRLAAGQMTRNEWRCFIALKEGVLFRDNGAWFVVPPPAKAASAEVCGRHYGLAPATVERYERSARKLLDGLRRRAGLLDAIPAVPIWPAINSDEQILRYLFGLEG